MRKDKIINNYEEACQDIAEKINEVYFDGEANIDWVAGDIGGIATISDYFFDMNYMTDALKYGASEKQFFDFYQLGMEEKHSCNFKNYILYYKGFKK